MKRVQQRKAALAVASAAMSISPFMAGVVTAEQTAAGSSALLDEVVVTGTRTPHSLKDTPVETVLLNQQDIQQSNAQNAIDVLKTVPGINTSVHDDVLGTYSWRANMRGLNFNDGYGLVLIDGQRVMGCGQSGGMGEYGVGLNQLPVDMIERIEVVKGPSSALYGSDALAGVVNIITKDTPDKPSGKAGAAYGWYTVKEKVNSDGSISLPSDDGEYRSSKQAYASFGDRPVDKIGYLVSYNYESAEDVSQSPLESLRHSLLAKMNLAASDKVDLSLKGEASNYEKEGNRDEDSWRIAPGMEWRLADGQTLAFKGYTYTWDFVHGTPGNINGYKYGTINFNQAEAQHTWQVNAQNTLVMGAEFQQQAIDYLIDNPNGSTTTVNKDVDTASLYGQDEFKLLDDLTLVGGFRFDDHSVFGSEINPKLSAMYNLSDSTTLRASAGRAFKSPTIRQLYYDIPYRHGDYYNQSNPDLKPEVGMGYSASIEQWLLDGQLMTSAGLFRNDVEDMVIVEDTGAMYDGLPLMLYRNVDEAMTQGLELTSKLELNAFSLNASYTYTDSENKESGLNLPYVPEHSFSLVPAYVWNQYGLGLSGTLTCTGKQYKDNQNKTSIDGHSVIDAKLWKEFYWKELSADKLVLSVEADNILDSDKGDDASFRSGRAFLVKLDVSF